MPSIDQNVDLWTNIYRWDQGGDDWSEAWHDVPSQWFSTLYPRIRHYLPTGTLLEIAPGYGRWSEYLGPLCDRYIGVDLTEHCIAACMARFSGRSNMSFHVNDGRSLPVIADGSVEFCFSFDSLVHAEPDVIGAYLSELSRVLAPEGVAFLHHSNLGAYATELEKGTVQNTGWRDELMTARRFVELVRGVGLSCPGQELLNWLNPVFTDCFSLVTRHGSTWDRPHQIVENPDFTAEARSTSCLARIYVPSKGSP